MSWQCPYCSNYATLSKEDISDFDCFLRKATKAEKPRLFGLQIVCPNPNCNQMSLSISINEAVYRSNGQYEKQKLLHKWTLLPISSAKPQPDYIPEQIVQDYNEACSIRDLSPKASATLSRRCLQGMIRDFWQIKKATLFAEINELEDKVPTEVWVAIKAVKDIGNIGAHMEKDINVIVDVDAGEAQMLISLIEQLFEDWYVTAHNRKLRMAGLTAMAAEKTAARILTNKQGEAA